MEFIHLFLIRCALHVLVFISAFDVFHHFEFHANRFFYLIRKGDRWKQDKMKNAAMNELSERFRCWDEGVCRIIATGSEWRCWAVQPWYSFSCWQQHTPDTLSRLQYSDWNGLDSVCICRQNGENVWYVYWLNLSLNSPLRGEFIGAVIIVSVTLMERLTWPELVPCQEVMLLTLTERQQVLP